MVEYVVNLVSETSETHCYRVYSKPIRVFEVDQDALVIVRTVAPQYSAMSSIRGNFVGIFKDCIYSICSCSM